MINADVDLGKVETPSIRPDLIAFAKDFESERFRLLDNLNRLRQAVDRLKPLPNNTGGGIEPIDKNEPIIDFLNRQLVYFMNHIDEVEGIVKHLDQIV